MEEWKDYKLGDIYEVHNGLSKGGKFFGSGFPFLSFSTIFKNWFIPNELTSLVQSTEKEQESYSIKKGDIFVTRTSETADELGMSCVALKNYPKATYNGFCKRMRQYNQNVEIDPRFIGYYLRNPTFRLYFQAFAGSMSTRASLTNEALLGLPLKLPPLPTQQKIAAILSSLDDKIELNNRINENLEQQAQALFKNWFVDFEPFGGKIPEGWKKIPMENLCSVITKGTTPTTLGKKFTETGINFIKGESILENHNFDLQKISHIDEETNTMLKRSIIEPNDILFTIAGTLGRFAMIDESLTPANTNQAVGIIRANPKIVSPYYLYSFFIGNWHNDYYTKRIQQAVQANLSLGTIKSLPIIIPDSQNLNKYTSLIEPLFKQMKQLENENIKLSTLRDTLLPKLMNGEIEMDSISNYF